MDFVHLHVHTQYSLLDGCCRINKLIDRAVELGQKSIAITDHGVMYGAVEFYKYALSKGVKPIIGCEVYVAPKSRFIKQKTIDGGYNHLVLLCKNNEGYQNLIKLVSLGFTEGFYMKPRIDKDILRQYSKGLIGLSACLAGEIPQKLINGEYDKAKETALLYEEIFGTDNFYLEIQDHGIAEQKIVNSGIIRISKETGIPLVATNDVHYINNDDYMMHKVLLCIQTGNRITEENPIEFKTNEFYLKSKEQMSELFSLVPKAVENTSIIADKCNVTFEFGKIKLPNFDIGKIDHFEYFSKKCYDGLYRIFGDNPEEKYRKRLEYELSVINRMGYTDYYLIVADFVNYAKSKNIPVGPGRGSGAASLAALCIGITGIDPIKYDLYFERFLNPERVSMPDFDIDFCYVNRQKVIDYVILKYGSDHVSQIVTFGTMAARAAIRDVGRAMDIPYAICDKTAKLIPQTVGMTIDKAMSGSEELTRMYKEDNQIKSLIDMALKLEGMPRHASTHAAGVVISDKPVSEYVPLAVNDDAIVTQYTMTALEELGLLKMDFLGLRNLTVIADTEKYIKNYNAEFNIENINLNDDKTYEMMGKGDTSGVFQFESEGMKNVLRQLHPHSIEDLTAILSLYRPGPMDSIPKYIHNKHNPSDITYDTPLLKPILEITYGCIVYQEQVMQIFRTLAGYSLGRADIVRRAMAKKKHEVMQREREFFINGEKDKDGNVLCEGAVARGVKPEIAEKIFDEMSGFSSYAFNKAHAAAYAVVAYRTAFLKCHYTAEYFSSLMTSMMDNFNKISVYTSCCKKQGIKILPPSVNSSFLGFTPENKNIRFGLAAVKNLGPGVIEYLIEERNKNGAYKSFFDFVSRNTLREFSRKSLEGLIKSGALDGLGDNRHQMLFNIDNAIITAQNQRKFTSENQLNLFDEMECKVSFNTSYLPEITKDIMLQYEKESTGLYLSGHPLDEYEGYLSKLKVNNTSEIILGKMPDGKRVVIAGIISGLKVRQLKNNNIIATAKLEDTEGLINITAFSSAYNQFRPLLNSDAPIVITGRVSEREDRDTEIILEKAECFPENAKQIANSKIYKKGLYIKTEDIKGEKYNKIKKILLKYKGDIPVYIICTGINKKLEAKEIQVNSNNTLIDELSEIIGKDNIKLIN